MYINVCPSDYSPSRFINLWTLVSICTEKNYLLIQSQQFEKLKLAGKAVDAEYT